MEPWNAQLFQKLVRNFTGHSKTSKAFRDLVYDVYNFSQATAGPEKWLRQNLLKGQTEAKPEQAKNELLDGLKDGLLADFLAFLRDHLGLAQREFATRNLRPTRKLTTRPKMSLWPSCERLIPN